MASSKQVVGNPTPRVEGELKVSGAGEIRGRYYRAGNVVGQTAAKPDRFREDQKHQYQPGGSAAGRARGRHRSRLCRFENRPAALRHADPRRRRSAVHRRKSSRSGGGRRAYRRRGVDSNRSRIRRNRAVARSGRSPQTRREITSSRCHELQGPAQTLEGAHQ